MRILVNATSARLGGGITVLRNLLPALVAEDGGRNEYVVVAHEETARVIDPRHPRVKLDVSSHEGGIASRLVWEQLEIPAQSFRERVDLVFSPGGLAVFAAPVPQVLMYQNMAPFEPRVVSRAPAAEQRRFFLLRELGVLSGRIARRLVFISRYAQRSILPLIGGRAFDSRCVYLGRDGSFSPAAASAPLPFEVPERYLLSVSQFYFYKNYVELVEGFARAELPSDVALLLAGAEHEADYAAEVRRAVRRHGLEARVRFLGGVDYQVLPALYARALGFFFPSTVENFPNILVEGMSSGAPTFASKLGPMPEIAGEGAAYFDPYEPGDIARAMRAAVGDGELRARLRGAALERVKRYSWGATARGLLEVFAEAV